MYHDLPGLATTTLAADVQTSGAAVAGEQEGGWGLTKFGVCTRIAVTGLELQ